MFYYYGRKKQIAKYYPAPAYDTIIEPFAGAAAYSLYYNKLAAWEKSRKGEVIFCEGENGDYLDFKPLVDLKGVAGKTSKEVMYLQNAKTFLLRS